MNPIEALQNLGLNEKEARVYIALLKRNGSSAYVIADRAELKKPTTYVILDDLIEKGLVYKVPRAKKQLFVAKSPKEVFSLAEEKLSLAKEILPELLAMSDGVKSKPKTLFFEGMKNINHVYDWHAKQMQDKEIVGFYAHTKGVPSELLESFKVWAENFKKKNIKIRGIVPDSFDLKTYRDIDTNHNRQMRVAPFEKYSSNISIEICENYVIFFSFNDLQITLIENENIAKSVRQIFEMVWGHQKD